ncbi:hypothetical protein LEP1GSC150_5258 [Leptospira interrogans serovar Copenhageni str. LT2050]|uniref:Uncharacterized protein n=1 Tax=Leptospira interrogans serovar Copenhageni str. LT2050 TaxID=1001598 RepID=M3H8W3_LEPIT|nr:hypothetical protein LEP1GSC150_5258 [Leptospira interrogans serovar Copenhageni str. LT2050]
MLQALFVACSSKTPPDSKIIELLFSADEKRILTFYLKSREFRR